MFGFYSANKMVSGMVSPMSGIGTPAMGLSTPSEPFDPPTRVKPTVVVKEEHPLSKD